MAPTDPIRVTRAVRRCETCEEVARRKAEDSPWSDSPPPTCHYTTRADITPNPDRPEPMRWKQ